MQTLHVTKASFEFIIDAPEVHGNPPLGKRWISLDKEGYHTYMSN